MTYIELIVKDDLIKHLNTTMYRDVIEEIKNFPSVTPIIARQTNGVMVLVPYKKDTEKEEDND